MVEAHGPGHVALSDNHAGEVIALPLQHGQRMWVREHRFLCATQNIRYDWDQNHIWYVTGTGDDQEYHYPMGQYGDIFTAADRPGLLLLHSPGNTFIRDLRQGESLLVAAELAALPRRHRPGAPAPGVPAEHGHGLLAPPLELPEHLGQAPRPRPGSRAVGVRAARGHRDHPELLVRHAPPLVEHRAAAGTPEGWTGSRSTAASATRRARRSLSRRHHRRPGQVRWRRASSWCRSTTRGGCTGTSGWNATGCWSPGRCPKGFPTTPAVNHLAVHTEDHPLEYATFQGQIPRGEYGAGSVTIWDHGTYEALKWDDREVKVTVRGQRLDGGYVLFATGGRNWMIHRERLPLPASIRPMLATPGQPPSHHREDWAVEMKWDGVRALAFIEKGRLRLISRTGKDITATYPEVSGLAHAVGHKQVVLDGEVVAFSEGRPDFEALQSRMHVSSPAQAARLAADCAGHVPRLRRTPAGRAPADRPALRRAPRHPHPHHPERRVVALPAQLSRRGSRRRPHRLRGQRARGRGGQAAGLAGTSRVSVPAAG